MSLPFHRSGRFTPLPIIFPVPGLRREEPFEISASLPSLPPQSLSSLLLVTDGMNKKTNIPVSKRE